MSGPGDRNGREAAGRAGPGGRNAPSGRRGRGGREAAGRGRPGPGRRSASGVRRRLVVKVGGSLLDAGRAPALVRWLVRTAPRFPVTLLAGGGRAVDRLRARCMGGELSVEEAHWAAVRVLDVTALRLAGGCGPELPLVAHVPGPGAGASVLAPRALLRSEDPMPHTWSVTSDSIAAWIALRSGAGDVVLLKSRDGADRAAGPAPPRTPVRRASAEGLVDAHLPRLLDRRERSPRAWVLNGRHPGRLAGWLTGDPATATRLTLDG